MNRNSAGASLLESLAAILIFTFGSIVMLTMLTGAKRLNEAAHAEILAGQESQILRELGTQLTPGTVTLRLGDREETIEVFFSGEGDAVFFPEVGP